MPHACRPTRDLLRLCHGRLGILVRLVPSLLTSLAAVHVSILRRNTTDLASVTSCYTSWCTPDDVWTELAGGVSACAALGYGSGPGPGGVPATATANGGGGGGGSGGSTPTATAGGGAAATTKGKNAGSTSPAPFGRDYIMTTLFALAWIVGLAGFVL